MRGRLRRVFIALLILAGLVALAYQSRHKIHLADFTWKKFIDSVGQANIWLLLLALSRFTGVTRIRAVRWQRFCRYLGPTNFLNTFTGTLMGFAAIFVLGRAGEPVRPLLLGPQGAPAGRRACSEYSFLERFCDFAAAAVLACLSLLVFPNRLSDAGADMDWVDSARNGALVAAAGHDRTDRNSGSTTACMGRRRGSRPGAVARRGRNPQRDSHPRSRESAKDCRRFEHSSDLMGGDFLHGGALDTGRADLSVESRKAFGRPSSTRT